jgi:hypothetical protein
VDTFVLGNVRRCQFLVLINYTTALLIVLFITACTPNADLLVRLHQVEAQRDAAVIRAGKAEMAAQTLFGMLGECVMENRRYKMREL